MSSAHNTKDTKEIEKTEIVIIFITNLQVSQESLSQ